MPALVAYSCSKAAVSMFTEGLQTELTKYGVTSIGIEPSMYQTEIINIGNMEKSITNGWNEASDEVRTSYGTQAPESMINLWRYLSTDPFIVNPRNEDISDTVAEAMLSPEPLLVYECIQWKHWIGRKLTYHCMPWEIAVPLQNFFVDKLLVWLRS
jgi:NAD(P)-dependent dehydrogenase (short-subunit alcohol dehydrogenase family)